MDTTAGYTCPCRRTFDTKAGMRVHQRHCLVERRRSDAWVAAVERGDDPVAASEAAVREYRGEGR
jgi:hypothetical protein